MTDENKEFQDFVNCIVKKMLVYQKKNNIKKKCVDNAQILYDIITQNYPEVKCKIECCIVFSIQEQQIFVVFGHHRVVLNDEYFIDPSYEVYVVDEPAYFTTYTKFYDFVKECEINNTEFETFAKEGLPNFLSHLKLADDINKGEFIITDELYYKNVINFIMLNSIMGA